MNLATLIGKANSRANTNCVIKFVGEDQKLADQLVEIFLGSDKRLSQLAAWSVGDIGVLHPHLMQKHISAFLKKLKEKDLHDAIPRHIMRIFMHLEIPEKYCSAVLDESYRLLRNEAVAPAVRANAITVASRICARYPGLMAELRLVLNELSLIPQPPSIKVRVRQALLATVSQNSD